MADDLERLRREGAARLHDVDREKRALEAEKDAERRAEDDARMRLAVGRYHYRTLRGLVYWMALPGMLVFLVSLICVSFDLVENELITLGVVGGMFWLFGLLGLWGSELVWRAWPSTMQREEEWLRSRPFPIEGYFEWLRRYVSRDGASMRLVVAGDGAHRRREDLQLLIAGIHAGVEIDRPERIENEAHFVLRGIGSRDDDQRVRVFHEIVDRILVRTHHEAPIERVRIAER